MQDPFGMSELVNYNTNVTKWLPLTDDIPGWLNARLDLSNDIFLQVNVFVIMLNLLANLPAYKFFIAFYCTHVLVGGIVLLAE